MGATTRPIVIAAGGTGGHIFPAEALAEALMNRGERVVLFTDPRFAKFKSGVFTRVETHTVRAGRPGPGVLRKILAVANVAIGTVQAMMKLHELKPKAAVGFGGYPSFPTMLAAIKLRIPTVIHEQNAVLGRANRMLAPRVTRIATSFHHTLMIEPEDEPRIVLCGNPVRSGVRAVRDIPYATLAPGGTMQILVTGGSQGAAVFSQIVPAAIAALPAAVRSRIRIDQQCREADIEVTRAAYEQLGVSAQVSPFFTDIPARLAAAHLVIARSGASTVSELSTAGRPAILVPYPHAADNHQYFNANEVEDAGAGWVMAQDGFTATALSSRLEAFLGHPPTLAKAAEKARAMGRPDAAIQLAEMVLGVVG